MDLSWESKGGFGSFFGFLGPLLRDHPCNSILSLSQHEMCIARFAEMDIGDWRFEIEYG